MTAELIAAAENAFADFSFKTGAEKRSVVISALLEYIM